MNRAKANKRAPGAATPRARSSRRQKGRQPGKGIIPYCIRLCILLLGLTGLCGLGALLEEGRPCGLVLAAACALLCRELLRLLPKGGENLWR